MEILTNTIVNYSTSKHCPVSKLTLNIRESLLIVLAHYKTKAIVSHGLLSLRYNGIFEWHDTDSIETFTDLKPRCKQLIGSGFDVCLAYPGSDRVWFEYDLSPCQYFSDRVIIPVEPSNLVLGL
ncbi:hypothetical protein [Chamaesiphon sp.]|uniref:hypothetical protein n=1 Tax=Chamaesiphon sp. TaxID=2814140 RepID=UPI003593C817